MRAGRRDRSGSRPPSPQRVRSHRPVRPRLLKAARQRSATLRPRTTARSGSRSRRTPLRGWSAHNRSRAHIGRTRAKRADRRDSEHTCAKYRQCRHRRTPRSSADNPWAGHCDEWCRPHGCSPIVASTVCQTQPIPTGAATPAAFTEASHSQSALPADLSLPPWRLPEGDYDWMVADHPTPPGATRRCRQRATVRRSATEAKYPEIELERRVLNRRTGATFPQSHISRNSILRKPAFVTHGRSNGNYTNTECRFRNE